MAVPSPERRNAPRHPAVLLCASADDPRLIGRSRDVSATGAFVEWPVRPAPGAVVDVGFAWRDQVWSCRARVVRLTLDGAGLAFVDPSASLREALARAVGSPV